MRFWNFTLRITKKLSKIIALQKCRTNYALNVIKLSFLIEYPATTDVIKGNENLSVPNCLFTK